MPSGRHRQRQTAAAPPDTEDFDQALRSRLQEITRTAQAILTAIDQPNTPAQELLATMVHLQVTSERLAPDMVARTKLRGASWEQIAAPLGMSKDAARKKWASPRRAQALQPTRPTPPPVAKPPGNGPTARSAPDGKDTGRDSAAPQAPHPPPGSHSLPGLVARTWPRYSAVSSAPPD